MEQYNRFRAEYPRFYYRDYGMEWTDDQLKLSYRFEIEGLSQFTPCWTIPLPRHRQVDRDDAILRRMAFSLGMVELVSYWKITCSPEVIVEAGGLDKDQIAWWKDLYYNGLGEFFYVNHIEEADPDHFMDIRCVGPALSSADRAGAGRESQGTLVPIGGGKDSAVTLELLKSAGETIWGYIINPRGATIHTAEVAGLDKGRLICAKRTLDPNMLELNKKGFLNGHTPFSAIVAFSSVLAARLYGLSCVALSNESSANESTVKGTAVNHQYSKSFKFELGFHTYVRRYLPGSAYYFSMLRPLSEYQIARYFARCSAYHRIFRSCNAGSKTDVWCAHCPKCLFVYLILSPFLAGDELRAIFGADMLEDGTMLDTFRQLMGEQEEKPFECVGSRSEVNAAIVETIQRLEQEGKPLPFLLSYYRSTGYYEKYCKAGAFYSSYYDEENLVPENWARVIRKECVW